MKLRILKTIKRDFQKKPEKKKINPKEILEKKRSYCDEIHDTLEKQGVVFPVINRQLNINSEFLSLPASITEVTSQELGEYLNAYTQQKVYMRTLLGYAEMYAEEAHDEYVEASSADYRSLLDMKYTETAKEREITTRENIRPYYKKWKDYQNQIRLLNIQIENIEDIIFMISREVSRRTGDFSEEMRNYRVGRN